MAKYREGDEVTIRLSKFGARALIHDEHAINVVSCVGSIIHHKPAPEPEVFYISHHGPYKITLTEGQEPKIERV